MESIVYAKKGRHFAPKIRKSWRLDKVGVDHVSQTRNKWIFPIFALLVLFWEHPFFELYITAPLGTEPV